MAFMTGYWNGHQNRRAVGDTSIPNDAPHLPYPDRYPTVEETIHALENDGVVVFPGALTADEVATWRRRIDAMGSANDDDYVVPGWCYNKQIRSDFHLNPDYLELIDRPVIVDAVEAVLSSDDTGPARVLFGSSWVTGAGRGMGLHIDYLPISLPEDVLRDPRVKVPIFFATVQFYLDDLTPDHGATAFVPGSHRAGRLPQDENSWNGIPAQIAMLKAGDAALFRSDVWHGATMNRLVDGRRYIMQVGYAMGKFAPQYPPIENAEKWNPEVLARVTERQRRLLGGAKRF